MSALPTNARPFPLWLKLGCSVCALGHLLIIGLLALAARSGPWLMPAPFNGPSMVEGPQFAKSVTEGFTVRYYLDPLHMTHNYHFISNRPNDFAVYFEIELKNELGEVKTLKFPDEKANFWVRHRQELLAQFLVPDQRLPPRGSRRLAPAKSKEAPKVEIWRPDGERIIRLIEVPELDPALDNPDVDQPTPRVKLLAQSYTRYVCEEHKAASAQLVRHSRQTIMPIDLFVPRRAEDFSELKSYFGEYRREQ